MPIPEGLSGLELDQYLMARTSRELEALLAEDGLSDHERHAVTQVLAGLDLAGFADGDFEGEIDAALDELGQQDGELDAALAELIAHGGVTEELVAELGGQDEHDAPGDGLVAGPGGQDDQGTEAKFQAALAALDELALKTDEELVAELEGPGEDVRAKGNEPDEDEDDEVASASGAHAAPNGAAWGEEQDYTEEADLLRDLGASARTSRDSVAAMVARDASASQKRIPFFAGNRVVLFGEGHPWHVITHLGGGAVSGFVRFERNRLRANDFHFEGLRTADHALQGHVEAALAAILEEDGVYDYPDLSRVSFHRH